MLLVEPPRYGNRARVKISLFRRRGILAYLRRLPLCPTMISIIIPTLNEAENIEPLVRQIIESAAPPIEIIFVDDGSTDGTAGRIRALASTGPVQLIERPHPKLGLAGAVIAGVQAARGEIVVVMDADLSHPPAQIVNLVNPVRDGVADMVIGSRYVKGASTPGWPIWRKVLSRIAAGVAYPLTGVHDSMCGFFAMRRAQLLELTTAATGFKIAFEAIVHGGRGLRVLEIPIVFRDRMHGTSKMSLGVVMLFSFRWLAGALRILSGRRAQL